MEEMTLGVFKCAFKNLTIGDNSMANNKERKIGIKICCPTYTITKIKTRANTIKVNFTYNGNFKFAIFIY